MKYLSVCSGIEAATVAWHGLGWTPVGFSEIEPFPRAVLAHHYPAVPNYGDLTAHETWPIAPGSVDLIVGGTPCQSFSVAGLRAGMADPRGNLALVYLALVARMRPRWIVWENVPGVLSSSGGRDFGAFVGGLAELGYGWAYRVLDAQHFGVPQRRRRVFVVGHSGGCWQRAAAVLFERESLRGDTPPGRAARESLAPCLASRTKGGGGLGTDFDLDGGLIAASVTSKWAKGTGGPSGDECQNLVPMAFAQNSRDEVRFFGGDGQVVGALTAEPGMKQTTYLAFSPQSGGDLRGLDLTPTAQLQRCQVPGVMAAGVRRLTPRECERLQGFPDDYTLVPYRAGMSRNAIVIIRAMAKAVGKPLKLKPPKPASDGPRYKALGNSMAAPCMEWMGERIAQVDAIPHQ